ncbi:DUF5667 domain-containing protein [Chloroflexota bacterium]
MKKIEEALNDCIERMTAGESLDSCLSRYPDLADELKPLLELSHAVTEISLSVKPRAEFKVAARYRFHDTLAQKESKSAKTAPAPRRWHFKWATVAVAMLVIFVVGGGMGVASANSMPGDPLYRVKTLTERIRMGLTFGSENKARLHLDFAEERSEEIQTLIDGGNLEAANDIGVEMTNHVESARAAAPRLLESKEIVVRLETLANKQVALLEAIYDKAPTGAQEAIDTLIESVNDAYETVIEDISGSLPDIQIMLSGTPTLTEGKLTGTIEITNNSDVNAEVADVKYSISYPTGPNNNLWKPARIIMNKRNTLGGLEEGTGIDVQETKTFEYSVNFAVPDDTSKIRGIISITLDGRNLRYYDIAEFTILTLQSVDSLTVVP